MIERKRAIPRIAVASLTMGGTAAAAGCGGDGTSSVAEWCQHKATCRGEDITYVQDCVEDYQADFSYYGTMCAGAIGRAVRCYLEQIDCNELSYFGYSDCYAEQYAVDEACVPPPPPPAPEGDLRDFCELVVECYDGYYGYYYTVDECHQYYSRLVDEYAEAYGPDCEVAIYGLLGCYADLTCEELYSFDEYTCASEYETFYADCY